MHGDKINKLKLAKYGRATNVHKMKEKVTGSKKPNKNLMPFLMQNPRSWLYLTIKLRK